MAPANTARRSDSIATLVASAFLDTDLLDVDDDERSAACDYVNRSIAAMPDITRVGVQVASSMVNGVLTTLGRRPFRAQPRDRRSQLTRVLAGTSLPVVSEFVVLTRGLGLVGVLEQRYSSAATTHRLSMAAT